MKTLQEKKEALSKEFNEKMKALENEQLFKDKYKNLGIEYTIYSFGIVFNVDNVESLNKVLNTFKPTNKTTRLEYAGKE